MSVEPERPFENPDDVRSVTFREASYVGPIPPAGVAGGWEALIPGAAERIFAMAEREQSHRHAVDLQTLKQADRQLDLVRDEDRDHNLQTLIGISAGLTVSIGCIAAGVCAIFNGQAEAGAGIIASTIVSLAGCFIVGKLKSNQDKPAN